MATLATPLPSRSSPTFEEQLKDLSAECYKKHREINTTAKKALSIAICAITFLAAIMIRSIAGKILVVSTLPFTLESLNLFEIFDQIPHSRYYNAGHDLLGQRFPKYLQSLETPPTMGNILNLHRNYKKKEIFNGSST